MLSLDTGNPAQRFEAGNVVQDYGVIVFDGLCISRW